MKRFNTTGKCIASQHYMVRIDHQVNVAAEMVDRNLYFCINRGRQYGKTTTLAFLKEHLEANGYAVFSISFEGLPDSAYDSVESLLYQSVNLMALPLKWTGVSNLKGESSLQLVKIADNNAGNIGTVEYRNLIASLCSRDKVVLIIDEVD